MLLCEGLAIAAFKAPQQGVPELFLLQAQANPTREQFLSTNDLLPAQDYYTTNSLTDMCKITHSHCPASMKIAFSIQLQLRSRPKIWCHFAWWKFCLRSDILSSETWPCNSTNMTDRGFHGSWCLSIQWLWWQGLECPIMCTILWLTCHVKPFYFDSCMQSYEELSVTIAFIRVIFMFLKPTGCFGAASFIWLHLDKITCCSTCSLMVISTLKTLCMF